jgi:hypothetical protein
MEVLDKALPSKNLGTNIEKLHTPTSTPKKLKGNSGDKKKKLELDKVLYENKPSEKLILCFKKS